MAQMAQEGILNISVFPPGEVIFTDFMKYLTNITCFHGFGQN